MSAKTASLLGVLVPLSRLILWKKVWKS